MDRNITMSHGKKYPKVIKVKHVKHIVPKSSCGTGYSEPDEFEFWLNDGDYFTDIIDTWYRTDDDIVRECRKCCEKLPIMNPTETLEMLLEYYENDRHRRTN